MPPRAASLVQCKLKGLGGRKPIAVNAIYEFSSALLAFQRNMLKMKISTEVEKQESSFLFKYAFFKVNGYKVDPISDTYSYESPINGSPNTFTAPPSEQEVYVPSKR